MTFDAMRFLVADRMVERVAEGFDFDLWVRQIVTDLIAQRLAQP